MRLVTSCMAHGASKHPISPNSQPLQACKDCKHFHYNNGIQQGRCKLFGVQDLVDGTIRYDYASIAREYKCKGVYFEEKQNTIIEFMKQYNIDFDAPRTYDK
jgi:hypothetical protein